MKFQDLNRVAEQHGIGGDNDGFFTLEKGANPCRIVSEYEVLGKHWAGNKPTVCVGKENGCTFCSNGDKPGVKFLMWAFDRKDNKAKILEVGWTVVKALSDFQQHPQYKFEDLPGYDVDVVKTVNGSGTKPSDTEYSVVPHRNDSALTDEEKSTVAHLTPIKEVVDAIKSKTLKEYQAMGLAPANAGTITPAPATTTATPEPAAAQGGLSMGNDAPSFLS